MQYYYYYILPYIMNVLFHYPVFYGVNRWKRGRKNRIYPQALLHQAVRIMEQRKPLDSQKWQYEFDPIEKWRNALFHVAEIDDVFELEMFNR